MERPSFVDIMAELNEMQLRKGNDYGTETDSLADIVSSKEFGIDPWLNAIVRINSKIARLKSYVIKGALSNESVDDSMVDIAVYAIHAIRLYRESTGTRKPLPTQYNPPFTRNLK